MKRIWLGAIIIWEFMRYALGSLMDERPTSNVQHRTSKEDEK